MYEGHEAWEHVFDAGEWGEGVGDELGGLGCLCELFCVEACAVKGGIGSYPFFCETDLTDLVVAITWMEGDAGNAAFGDADEFFFFHNSKLCLVNNVIEKEPGRARFRDGWLWIVDEDQFECIGILTDGIAKTIDLACVFDA